MKQPQVVIEIAGPAGAGKSSLSVALHQRDTRLQPSVSIWDLPLYLLVVKGISSLSLVLGLCLNCRTLPLHEITHMIRLNALLQFSKRRSPNNCRALVLDEGAVFTLAKLHAFSREITRSDFFIAWSQTIFSQWADTLNAIVWLDASDSVLAHRIRIRDKWHQVKDLSDHEIYDFLREYRASYEVVISRLKAGNTRLMVMRFNTDQDSLERIADQVLAEMQREPGAWQRPS